MFGRDLADDAAGVFGCLGHVHRCADRLGGALELLDKLGQPVDTGSPPAGQSVLPLLEITVGERCVAPLAEDGERPGERGFESRRLESVVQATLECGVCG